MTEDTVVSGTVTTCHLYCIFVNAKVTLKRLSNEMDLAFDDMHG